MQHIETVTVGSGGAASITFSAIPDTYTDLLVVVSGRTNRSSVVDAINFKPNNQTSNRSMRVLQGSGSSAVSFSNSEISIEGPTGNNATSNTFGNVSFYIPSYRSSVAKSISGDGVSENNATAAYQTIMAALWNSTDPITSIVLAPLTGTLFLEHSTASLFGITAGSDGIVAVS